MATTYTPDTLRQLFQSAFDLSQWQHFLQHFFSATELKTQPERIDNTSEEGYYLGNVNTKDSYLIGFFVYHIHQGSVINKRVGLRNLVKTFINRQYGQFDAALVVFDSGDHWRLSFICDIRGEATAPKRFTYVLGSKDTRYKTPIERFLQLQNKGISFENIKDAFSVEALTKEFYNKLFDWYQWVISPETNIKFPDNTKAEYNEEKDIKIIRLITRLMFVWFIKQKQLVPDNLFDVPYLHSILKDFDPLDPLSGTYYNAILQNLFFATLNKAIIDEEGNSRTFATTAKPDIKTLYRYKELFRISEQEVIKLFADIPFLNGGLFECLDKNQTQDGTGPFYNDGFSRNENKRAFIPNIVFFEPEKGLFPLLRSYNFTIEENSPSEQQVALDPELLGKVFENLLGAYNPETQETARNESGSFYTPREVVNYMVDESIVAYLKSHDVDNETTRLLLDEDFFPTPDKQQKYAKIANLLQNIKVLDPACGSGAFPMGLLHRLVDILQKIQPHTDVYNLKRQIIENCLYGSDIQPIAAQITKLRFFISLICDCEKNTTQPNFGIHTLPNLETKFVTANSLIAKQKKEQQGNLFDDGSIGTIQKQLQDVRRRHFSAKKTNEKINLRKQDEALRLQLATLLENNHEYSPDDAKQLAKWDPYDQNAVSPFFDPEWMFGLTDGFDIVIGNPPYIQLQNNNGTLGKLYKDCGYKTFAATGDIYCLFYERGYQLLKQGGHLCYITSNKWMRAGYGEKTRAFFAEKTDPQLLIDFAGVKIFESATVDTNILLFAKSGNQHHTIAAVANEKNKECVKQLSHFIQQEHTIYDFATSDSWVVLSPIEQSIKRKIESVGTPLKDWDIQIYRGVLTGCNEAFIISTEKRNEILSNTVDYVAGQKEEDYDPTGEYRRTADLIRPILRGRDIKRYGYNWAGLWLINAHNGVKGKYARIRIEDYPAVKHWLDYGGIAYNGKLYRGYPQIAQRADQGDTPYNLRNCAYLDDFNKPKIVYPNMTKFLPFYWDKKAFLTNQKCFIITGKHIAFLTALFNSSLFKFCFIDNFPKLGDKGRELSKIFFDKISILQVTDDINKSFIPLIEDIQKEYTKEKAIAIDTMIFNLYNLSNEERQIIGFIELQ